MALNPISPNDTGLTFPQPDTGSGVDSKGTRLQVSDYYQSHRFVVSDSVGYIQTSFAAGFSNCSVPEQNLEHIEYSEGTWTYSRYYPGRSTFNSVTLGKGVAKGTSKFASWVLACAQGANYRTDITIFQIHRSDPGVQSAPSFDIRNLQPSRAIVCKNCMPIRFRPGHDFDALTSDISIEEIEFQPEYFTINV